MNIFPILNSPQSCSNEVFTITQSGSNKVFSSTHRTPSDMLADTSECLFQEGHRPFLPRTCSPPLTQARASLSGQEDRMGGWGESESPISNTLSSYLGLVGWSAINWVALPMEIYSLTVLEARKLKSGCQQDQDPLDSGKNPSLLLPSFRWQPEILGDPWLTSSLLDPCLCHHMAFSLCIFILSSCKDISHTR